MKRILKNLTYFTRSAPLKNVISLKANNQRMFQFTTSLTMGVTSLYLFNNFNKANADDLYYEMTFDADYKDGEMRQVQVGPGKDDIVVVAKVEGKYYCVQGKCSHFGAPMADGILANDKIICPYHNAGFSIVNGYPENGPVFDGLQTYEVTEENGKVHLRVPKDKLNKNLQIPMSTKGNDPRRFVIIGGGAAGLSAAESLRQGGFEGEIVMISEDNYLPYDKTILSKNFSAPVNNILVRKEDFFQQYGIDVLKGTKVTDIDYDHSVITTQDGKHIKFERLLLATGGSARRPPVEGVNLANVHCLRNYSDVEKIQPLAADAKQVVVIGASFIGCEFASALKLKYPEVNVTVVDGFEAPFQRVLGKEVGQSLQSLHEANGVQFKLATSLQKLEGQDKVHEVVLSDGSKISADFVLLGTGITPNNSLAKNTLKISSTNGGFEVDVNLKTNLPNVYAAGDCASFPYWYTGQRIRTEHYSEAIKQGSVAAYNMLGKNQVFNDIPFFWTRHFNKSLHYTGYASQYDDVHITGDLSQQKFMAYYSNQGRVVAVAGMAQGSDVMIINEAMRLNLMPSVEEIKSGEVTIKDIAKRIEQKQPNDKKCQRANCCKNKKQNQ